MRFLQNRDIEAKTLLQISDYYHYNPYTQNKRACDWVYIWLWQKADGGRSYAIIVTWATGRLLAFGFILNKQQSRCRKCYVFSSWSSSKRDAEVSIFQPTVCYASTALHFSNYTELKWKMSSQRLLITSNHTVPLLKIGQKTPTSDLQTSWDVVTLCRCFARLLLTHVFKLEVHSGHLRVPSMSGWDVEGHYILSYIGPIYTPSSGSVYVFSITACDPQAFAFTPGINDCPHCLLATF